MLKRIAAIAAAGVLAFAIAGCSSGTSSSAASSATVSSASATASASASAGSSSASSALFSDLSWPQSQVTEEVPVPNFSVNPSSVNESDHMVNVRWDGLSDSEVLEYIEQIKAAGYTYDANESKSSNTYNYSARNNEDILVATNVIIGYVAKSDQNDSMLSMMVQRNS